MKSHTFWIGWTTVKGSSDVNEGIFYLGDDIRLKDDALEELCNIVKSDENMLYHVAKVTAPIKDFYTWEFKRIPASEDYIELKTKKTTKGRR